MKIISFAWTSPALLAGAKTVTRRDWTPSWAARFKAGEQVHAYNRSPRHGGKPIAVIRLTRDPYQEQLCDMPDSDWSAEGFQWFYEHPERLPKTFDFHRVTPEGFKEWQHSKELMWVVRFELVQ